MANSTSNKFKELSNATEMLRQAISKKGVPCNSDTALEDFATMIDDISQVSSPEINISYNEEVSSTASTWLSSARHNGRYIYYNNSSINALNDSLLNKLYGMGLQDATTTEYAFSGCSNLASLANFIYLPKVTNANYMFSSCSNLRDLSDTAIQLANNCTLSYMFQNCSNLTKAPLLLCDNNTSNSCYYLYSNCYKLDDIYNICHSAIAPTYLEGAFSSTPIAINSDLAQQVIDSMNLTNLSSMAYCFQHTNFTSIKGYNDKEEIDYKLDVSLPTLRSVNMNYMFYSWGYHNGIKFNYDFSTNTSGDAQYMFQEYGGDWDNGSYHPLRKIKRLYIPNKTYTCWMFEYCTFLEEVKDITISAPYNCEGMFYYCYRLKEIPVFNTSTIYYGRNMFYCCKAIEEFNLSDWTTLYLAYRMFQGCSKLKRIAQLYTPNLYEAYGFFSGCTALEIVPEFNTSRVTNMQEFFYNCQSLKEVPALNMNSCTYADSMFYNCINLEWIHCYNIRTSINISSSTKFTREALLEIINNLVNVGETRTLTMGATNLSKLTTADIAIATAKNWTLA